MASRIQNSDYRPTSDEHGHTPHNSPRWASPDAASNLVTLRAPIFIPRCREGRRAVVLNDALVSRRRRHPVERRHKFKIRTTDQRATRTDRRPIIHLGGPAPTPPVIQPVARIAASPGVSWLHADWPLAAVEASWEDAISAKGQSGTVQERSQTSGVVAV